MARASCLARRRSLTIAASGSAEFSRVVTPRTAAARSASCGADRRGTARAHLALCEIENRRAVTGAHRLGERPAAGELDIVTVCGDGEQVEGFRRFMRGI